MRALIQRISKASLTINGEAGPEIGPGLLVLLGIEAADNTTDIEWLSAKICRLRIFDDEQGIMNKSLADIDGEIMIVSQFTLHASTRKGNRPSYIHAARPQIAIPLYEEFIAKMKQELGKPVATGKFGANMQISLINDGPVTIWIDTKNKS